MNCNDVRSHLDARLPGEALDAAATAHLARCPDCRAHAASLELVDARLRATFGRLDVPADFGARLAARIAQEQERRPRTVDRREVESELHTWLARSRRESLVDVGALAAGGLAAAYAATQFAPAIGHWFERLDGGQNALVLGAVVAAAALAGAWIAVGDARRALFAK